MDVFFLVEKVFACIFDALPDQFFNPWNGLVRPSLGVGRDHDLPRQLVIFCGFNDVFGRMKEQSLFFPGLLLGNFVPDTGFPAVPPPPGVCKIKDFIEVHIKIGFSDDS